MEPTGLLQELSFTNLMSFTTLLSALCLALHLTLTTGPCILCWAGPHKTLIGKMTLYLQSFIQYNNEQYKFQSTFQHLHQSPLTQSLYLLWLFLFSVLKVNSFILLSSFNKITEQDYCTCFKHVVLLYYLFVCSLCPYCVSYAASWPGRHCKWEPVLNSPTWLYKGYKKQNKNKTKKKSNARI